MPVVVVKKIENGYNGHWMHVFQGANLSWLTFVEARIICGNFFIGLQAQSCHMYDVRIPKGATIVSATQRVNAFVTSPFNTVNVPMNTPDRLTHRSQPLVKPFEPFLGWRSDAWSNANISVLNPTLSLITQTSGGVDNAGWIVKQLVAPGGTIPNRNEMAQVFTPPSNQFLGLVLWKMVRMGAPTGSMRIRIEGVTTVLGVKEPDGVVLATSDSRLATVAVTAPTTGGFVSFSFTGADQIALVAGTEYFAIFNSDYPVLLNNYISLRHQNAFLTTGKLMHYGEGLGLDWQNFPGVIDCNQACQLNDLSTNIFWNLPRFIVNNWYTSPDISALVQAQVDATWYEPDSGIIISQDSPLAPSANRIWRSAASINNPEITITYIPRRIEWMSHRQRRRRGR